MRIRTLISGVGVVVLIACAGGRGPEVSSPESSGSVPAISIVGDWEGTLMVSGTQLRLVFHVAESVGGELGGTMDSPDQGAMGIPLTAVTVSDRRVLLAVGSIGGEFRGRLTEDGGQIEGTWRQAAATLPLRLTRGGT